MRSAPGASPRGGPDRPPVAAPFLLPASVWRWQVHTAALRPHNAARCVPRRGPGRRPTAPRGGEQRPAWGRPGSCPSCGAVLPAHPVPTALEGWRCRAAPPTSRRPPASDSGLAAAPHERSASPGNHPLSGAAWPPLCASAGRARGPSAYGRGLGPLRSRSRSARANPGDLRARATCPGPAALEARRPRPVKWTLHRGGLGRWDGRLRGQLSPAAPRALPAPKALCSAWRTPRDGPSPSPNRDAAIPGPGPRRGAWPRDPPLRSRARPTTKAIHPREPHPSPRASAPATPCEERPKQRSHCRPPDRVQPASALAPGPLAEKKLLTSLSTGAGRCRIRWRAVVASRGGQRSPGRALHQGARPARPRTPFSPSAAAHKRPSQTVAVCGPPLSPNAAAQKQLP
jgi:hypothetical protein